MDYALGAAALAAPNMFGFTGSKAPAMLTRGLGIYALASALTTRNKGGLLKALPYGAHLKMDGVGNLLPIAAPWLLGFASNKKARNVVLALAAVQGLVWLLSRRED